MSNDVKNKNKPLFFEKTLPENAELIAALE